MTQSASTANAPASTGTFAPLAQSTFAVLWVATILGNIGSFMRDVASAWLATDLSTSPAAVATIQAASTLPVFLLAIPAGVLSDILDRRRFLIVIQLCLALVSGSLMLLAWRQSLTIELLIALAFAGGIGSAMMGPTWQSIVPELVPANTLRQAVALNSLGVNIARHRAGHRRPAAGCVRRGRDLRRGPAQLRVRGCRADLVASTPATGRPATRALLQRGPRRARSRGRTASSMSCWPVPPCISRSAAVCGHCCRSWRASCFMAARGSTA
jgi:hypothetical protein